MGKEDRVNPKRRGRAFRSEYKKDAINKFNDTSNKKEIFYSKTIEKQDEDSDNDNNNGKKKEILYKERFEKLYHQKRRRK